MKLKIKNKKMIIILTISIIIGVLYFHYLYLCLPLPLGISFQPYIEEIKKKGFYIYQWESSWRSAFIELLPMVRYHTIGVYIIFFPAAFASDTSYLTIGCTIYFFNKLHNKTSLLPIKALGYFYMTHPYITYVVLLILYILGVFVEIYIFYSLIALLNKIPP